MSEDSGIYKRPDSKFWWARWINSKGEPARRSTKIRVDLDPHGIEAKRIRDAWANDKPRMFVPSSDMSWDDLVDAYLPVLKKNVRASTMERYTKALLAMLPYFNGKPMNMPSAEVKAYIRMRQADGYAPASINIHIGMMQGMYSWAIDELELDIQNPWFRKTLTVDNARDRYLTRDEVERLLDVARNYKRAPHMVDYIMLALNTGMRTAELLNLTWNQVDLDNGVITFDKDQQKNGKRSLIPINATARVILSKPRRSTHVICNPRGRPVNSIQHVWNTLRTRAGLPDVHLHDLRRTFASRLVQEGMTIQAVSRLLRHSDISITAARYAHLGVDDLRSVVAVLDEPPRLKIVKT